MRVYIDPADWWIGYYRGPNHHYVCPLPTVVLRWDRAPAPRRLRDAIQPTRSHGAAKEDQR